MCGAVEAADVEVCPMAHKHGALERVLACVPMRDGLCIFCPTVVGGKWLFAGSLCACESCVVPRTFCSGCWMPLGASLCLAEHPS